MTFPLVVCMSLPGLMVQSQRLHMGDIGTVFNLVLLADRAVPGSKGKKKKKKNIKKKKKNLV